MTSELTLTALKRQLAQKAETGALVYIKHLNPEGAPANLRIDGAFARTGYWSNSLAKFDIQWLLVYQNVGPSRGRVWVGDLEGISWDESGRGYDFLLSNLRGPRDVDMDVRELTNRKTAPQDPPVTLLGENGAQRRSVAAAIEDVFADNRAEAQVIEDLTKGTTRAAWVAQRVGQQKFRKKLATKWNYRCAVTGIAVLDTLVASHIIPWEKSSDKQRLDDNNGLLLVANLDRLFDRNLIAFKDNGALIISSRLGADERDALGLGKWKKLRLTPTKEMMGYLATHRQQLRT